MKKKKIYAVISVFFIAILSIGIVLFVKKQYAAVSAVPKYLKSTLSSNSTQPQSYIFDLTNIPPLIEAFQTAAESKIVRTFLPAEYKSLVGMVVPYSDQLQLVTKELINKDQKWLVLFQNSDEIRATGGFIGSYALIDITDGKVASITTEDIYDADGQFSGYVAPPSGVKEYLSSGNGLRLPDANWHPDTATSAQQILQFFALGNKQNISGVIFVNIEFAEKLLEIIGDIELVDYNTKVTSENISEVLRTRRSDFFPGSIQKKHMLSQLLTQVRIKIFSLSPSQLSELVKVVAEQLQLHHLQVYATDSTIDTIIVENQLRQSLPEEEISQYIYLVESNVGINKANKKISREVFITQSESKFNISLLFQNNNTPPQNSMLTNLVQEITENTEATQTAVTAESHLAYVNYQRIIVPKNWQLQSVTFEEKNMEEINTEQVPGFEHLQQVSVLVTIQEKETGKLEFTFKKSVEMDNPLLIQHQPGIPPTDYTIQYNNQTINKTIKSDTEIIF